MHPARIVTASAVFALVVGCTPAASTPPSAGPQPIVTPTPSPTSNVLDFTKPGVAKAMIRDLVRASSSTQVIMVSIREREAAVSVLRDGKPYTWAYRDGAITEVAADLDYVGQVAFDPDTFDLSDVGTLFRAAANLSGSASNQELQIIDLRRVEHLASELKMSVSTNPETRTVFFNADGTAVRTLDFNTSQGIAWGLTDAIGTHVSATAVSVSSSAGAYIEYPGADGATIVRRERRPKFPVLDATRSGSEKVPAFDPRVVNPSVIWGVLQRSTPDGFNATTVWSVVADVRAPQTEPRLHFTIGSQRIETDLLGNRLKE